MVLDCENVLLGSLDYISMKMCLRSIQYSFYTVGPNAFQELLHRIDVEILPFADFWLDDDLDGCGYGTKLLVREVAGSQFSLCKHYQTHFQVLI